MLTHPSRAEATQCAASYLGTMRQEVPGCVDYYPGWVDDPDRLFGVLEDEIAWEQHVLTLYGRTTPTPRLTAWMGDGVYRYSGIVNEPAHGPECWQACGSDFAGNWVWTSTHVWPISIETARIQWAITATTSPNWVHDQPSRRSGSGLAAGSCSDIAGPTQGGAGIWARAICWSCGMSRRAIMRTRFPRRPARSGLE
jgi:hypothetical protein